MGFAFSYLLGFKLLPRMKNIARQKLVKADAGGQVPSCLTGMVADKPVDSEIIAQQYDQMVKYATALRLGTAEAEQVLRRFTRGCATHPTYKAIEELGKAVKSVFVTEYIASQDLRREIHEGLQVVENWNSANTDQFYGSAGTIPGSDKEHQEVSMLSLHLLQSALVFINTLLVQSLLKDPTWQQKMTDADKRGLECRADGQGSAIQPNTRKTINYSSRRATRRSCRSRAAAHGKPQIRPCDTILGTSQVLVTFASRPARCAPARS